MGLLLMGLAEHPGRDGRKWGSLDPTDRESGDVHVGFPSCSLSMFRNEDKDIHTILRLQESEVASVWSELRFGIAGNTAETH